MNSSLSLIDYLTITDFLWNDRQNRAADRYFGLLFDSDELEKKLKDKFFAVNTIPAGTKAVIFSEMSECNFFCTLDSKYYAVDFEEFKRITGDKWKNTSHYHQSKNSSKRWITYIDGERFDWGGDFE